MPVFMCGRSLSAWWCMVAGNVRHHVEREGELSGQGNVPGGYVPGESPGGMSYTLPTICSGVTAEKKRFRNFHGGHRPGQRGEVMENANSKKKYVLAYRVL